MQGAECARDRIDRCPAARLVGHVGENETGGWAEFGGERFTGFPIHIGNGDSAAAGDEHSRGGRPETGSATRHEKNLVIDIHGHTPHDAVIYSARVGVILRERLGDPPCENPPNRLEVFATGVDETAEKAVDKDTVSICFVKEAIYGASQRGLDVDAMLRSAGISPDLLELPDARVSAAHYGVLWHVVARALNDELFGLDSHPMRHGSFKLLCFAVLGAGTLEKAIRRALDFLALVLDDTQGRLGIDGSEGSIILICPRTVPRLFAHGTLLMILHGLMCWLANRRLPILRTAFMQASPDHADEYRLLFGPETRFGVPDTTLVFEAEHLALPIRRNEAALREFLRNAPANFLVKYRDSRSLYARIRKHLQRISTPEWPEFETIAREFHVSPSTLRRKLESEGQTFMAIKDSLRRDMAIEQLCHSQRNILDIALELGFSETSAFYRAFKSWTGTLPGKYRRDSKQAGKRSIMDSELRVGKSR